MSLEPLKHVIVGGGHAINQIPHLVEQVAHIADYLNHVPGAIENLARPDVANNVAVGARRTVEAINPLQQLLGQVGEAISDNINQVASNINDLVVGIPSTDPAERVANHIVVNGGHMVSMSSFNFYKGAESAMAGADRTGNLVVKEGRRARRLARNACPSEIKINYSMRQERPSRITADVESRAWDNFIDTFNQAGGEHIVEGLKDAALSAGCAAAGDIGGAYEYGAAAVGEVLQAYLDQRKYIDI